MRLSPPSPMRPVHLHTDWPLLAGRPVWNSQQIVRASGASLGRTSACSQRLLHIPGQRAENWVAERRGLEGQAPVVLRQEVGWWRLCLWHAESGGQGSCHVCPQPEGRQSRMLADELWHAACAPSSEVNNKIAGPMACTPLLPCKTSLLPLQP